MNFNPSSSAPQPPSSGFKNIKPLTRKERRALKDKVALEKQRLMNRTGLAAKMYRENAPENPSELLTLQSNAAGFLADADRYHSDTAGEEFQARKKVRSGMSIYVCCFMLCANCVCVCERARNPPSPPAKSPNTHTN